MEKRLNALQGQILRTEPRQCAFKITDVTTERITFVPEKGNGTPRWERTETILAAANKPWDNSELRQRIQEWHINTRNSSYIAAIVRELKK